MSDVRKVSDSDALALLALQAAPICRQTMENMDAWASGDSIRGKTLVDGTLPLAHLKGHNFEYTMRKTRVTIGRSDSLEDVDVKVGHSTFVSRVHLEIFWADAGVQRPKFFIRCHGKNGIFVDGIFRRKGADAVELPLVCVHLLLLPSLYYYFYFCLAAVFAGTYQVWPHLIPGIRNR